MKFEKEVKFVGIKITIETKEEKEVMYQVGNYSMQIAELLSKGEGLDRDKTEEILIKLHINLD